MPHSSLSKYIKNADWDSKEKIEARFYSIIDSYREAFGLDSIPEDKQYWSMCGSHFNSCGPLKGELGQMLEYGLINKDQYFGVDKEEYIITNNKKIYPDVNWICGDFLDSMKIYNENGIFNPSIINYDGVMQPEFGSQYLKQILKFIDYNISNELLLIATFVLENPYNGAKNQSYDISEVGNQICKRYRFYDHWFPSSYTYVYSHSKAKMGVVFLAKEEHNPKRIMYNGVHIQN